MLGRGPRRIRRRLLRLKRALVAAFTAIPGFRSFRGYSGPAQHSLPRSPGRPSPLDRHIARRFRALTEEATGASLLSDGAESLAARLSLVDLAGRSLDLQTYIWELDRTGRQLLSHVLAAADRGVRVRLLLDDTSTFREERSFVALDRHPSVHVRFFNPFQIRTSRGFLRRLLEFLVDFRRLHRRMHVKSWLADGRCAIVGGRNVADAYYTTDAALSFRDLDLFFVGAEVGKASAAFDAHWNSRWAVPVPHVKGKSRARLGRLRARLVEFGPETEAGVDELAAREGLESVFERMVVAPVEVVADPPEKLESEEPSEIALRLAAETRPLEASLDVETAYLVLPEVAINLLADRVRHGVRVRLLTNSLATTDVIAAHAAYLASRRPLLEAGVELYELRPGPALFSAKGRRSLRSRASLHAKAMAFDCRRVYVGSLNLDPRSIRWNTEIGVFVDSRDLAIALVANLDEGLSPERSWRVELSPERGDGGALRWVGAGTRGEIEIHRSEPRAGLGRRAACALLARLPLGDLL